MEEKLKEAHKLWEEHLLEEWELWKIGENEKIEHYYYYLKNDTWTIGSEEYIMYFNFETWA